MTTDNKEYEVLITGQGAAAYAAAMYSARYQNRVVMVGEMFGGESATGGKIENYPGFTEIDGFDLMLRFRESVEKYGVPIIDDKVVTITRSENGVFTAKTALGSSYTTRAVILAVGRQHRTLKLEHEHEWRGKGVSYCATCDAPLHRGNTVVVVGGGDAAIKGALLIARYAKTVYVVHRRDRFTRPAPVLLKQLVQAANIVPVMNATIVALKGNEHGLTGIVLSRDFNGSRELDVHGLFVEIGADPRTELAIQLGVGLNELKEIKVDRMMGTNVPGVFAAGDATDGAGEFKQIITAAAQGAMAATSAYNYLTEL